MSPDDAPALARAIAAHALPLALPLSYAALAAQALASVALLANRLVAPACAVHLVVLAAGVWILHWPDWFAAGGAVTEGHPGAEFSVLLMVALAGVGLGQRARTEGLGLDVVRVGCVLVMATHPLHLAFDPEGIQDFGRGLEHRGLPCGVLLVCALTGLQLFGVAAFLARRLVVPGAAGMLFVHAMGMVLHHKLRWFAVGPGEEGNEFPAMLLVCFAAVLLAHLPRTEAGDRARVVHPVRDGSRTACSTSHV